MQKTNKNTQATFWIYLNALKYFESRDNSSESSQSCGSSKLFPITIKRVALLMRNKESFSDPREMKTTHRVHWKRGSQGTESCMGCRGGCPDCCTPPASPPDLGWGPDLETQTRSRRIPETSASVQQTSSIELCHLTFKVCAWNLYQPIANS